MMERTDAERAREVLKSWTDQGKRDGQWEGMEMEMEMGMWMGD